MTMPRTGPLARYVSALQWLRSYDRIRLRYDAVLGLTASAGVVPLGMAYGAIIARLNSPDHDLGQVKRAEAQLCSHDFSSVARQVSC